MSPSLRDVSCVSIDILRISVDEARTIRDAVLRSTLPAGGSIYPGDDAADTLHIGAFVNGEFGAVATICREPMPEESNSNEWRLRGMATLEKFRGIGLGRCLAEKCFAHAANNGGILLWGSARISAATFYRSLGFKKQGKPFRLPEYSNEIYILMRRLL